MSNNFENIEDLEVIDGEYINKTDLETAKKIEEHIEKNINFIFERLGINANRIKETKERTPDYSSNHLDFEITAFHPYIPQIKEIDDILKIHKENYTLICAYLFLEREKPRAKIIHQKNLENELSILCLRQHISLYKPKIFRKINDKYSQSTGKDQIIIMDFRLSHFDSFSLKKVISEVLKEKCIGFSSLIGILGCIPRNINSKIFDEPDFFFVKNPFFEGNNPLISTLNLFSTVQTDIWITIEKIYVKVKSGNSFDVLCRNKCPGKKEIETMHLPTI